ncbi:MAG: GDSL-type esterase/lipase family protein [Chitinophagaceae bacterium]
MKRIIVFIGIIYSSLGFAQIKVACIGNSITYGYGYDNPKSYPSQLDSLLGEAWEVRNFGVPGATLLRKGDAPYYKTAIYTDAKAFDPDVVIIKLGTNDSKAQNWKYKDDFVNDYDSLIYELEALPSKPFIILCTPVPAYSSGYGIRDSVIKVEMPLLQEIAKENKLKLINLYEPLSNHKGMFPDGIHPNEFGLGQIAATISESLIEWKEEILNRNK